MRFVGDGPSIPDSLIEQSEAGRVVFFCGAGVSCYPKNSGLQMPNFLDLTRRVVKHFAPPSDSEIVNALNSWNGNSGTNTVPLDQIFYLIQNTFCKIEVNEKISKILSSENTTRQPLRHKHISDISRNEEGAPQIVTTNFDVLFEKVASNDSVRICVPPFLPDLSQRSPITGITYLHGRIDENIDSSKIEEKYLNNLILSSAELGRAYLSEGWATNFVRYLVSEYTVVLIGYRAEDPPIHYLLMGMENDINSNNSKIYAFDRDDGDQEKTRARWEPRGVTPIMYSTHDILWETIEEWANKASNLNQWIENKAKLLSIDPKRLEPYERGQVIYLTRSVHGIRKIREASSETHPDWINVLDRNMRMKNEYKTPVITDKGPGMKFVYGLDEDEESEHINKNPADLLISEDNRVTSSMLEKIESVKKRHLLSWVISNIDKPIIALWAANQSKLSNDFLLSLRRKLKFSRDLDIKARLMWKFIAEQQECSLSPESLNTWDDFITLQKSQGWNTYSLREFSKLTTPMIHYSIKEMPRSLANDLTWQNIGDIFQVEVKFPKRGRENLVVPNEILPEAVSLLECGILKASLMISEVDCFNDTKTLTSTCYQDIEVYGDIEYQGYNSEIVWFLSLVEQLVKSNSVLAKSIVDSWLKSDQYFFGKLKLYMMNNESIFKPKEVASYIRNLSDNDFWCKNHERELMFLIADRYDSFTKKDKEFIGERTIEYTKNFFESGKNTETEVAKTISATRGLWLMKRGVNFSQNLSKKFVSLRESLERWDDTWVDQVAREFGPLYSRFGYDEGYEELKAANDSEIIDIVITDSEASHDYRNVGESLKDPFSGLVRENPERALSALSSTGRAESETVEYWRKFITRLPPDVELSLHLRIMDQLLMLSDDAIDEMSSELSEYVLNRHNAMFIVGSHIAWKVIDRFISVWIRGKATSKAGDWRSYGSAMEHPIGRITKSLLKKCPAKPGERISADIKLRFNELLGSSNRYRYCSASILTQGIGILYQCDPDWTETRLIPLFGNRDVADAAWNGLLNGGLLSDGLLQLLLDQIFCLFPWANSLSWNEKDYLKCVNLVIEVSTVFPKRRRLKYYNMSRKNLRGMSEAGRAHALLFLNELAQNEEKGWPNIVIPFLRSSWPKDTALRTQGLVESWIILLASSGEYFLDTYKIVKRFLVPISNRHSDCHVDLGVLIQKDKNDYSLVERFPDKVIELVDIVVPQHERDSFSGLGDLLAEVGRVRPDLTSDRKYVRLHNLVDL